MRRLIDWLRKAMAVVMCLGSFAHTETHLEELEEKPRYTLRARAKSKENAIDP